MDHSRRTAGAAVLAAAAIGVLGAVPASATSAPPSGTAGDPVAPSSVPGGHGTKKVTLITGDQVWLTRGTDGSGQRTISARIVPAKRPDGKPVAFAQWGSPERYYVVPSDMMAVAGSRVDLRIFDVAGLIDSGASASGSTRVIVSLPSAKGSSASALDASARTVTAKAKLPGGTVLPSANAVALTVPAGRAKGLVDQVAAPDASSPAYISLDARRKALDATSMRQIGAPSAWKSGYTGKGVKVAVLDTGIDATHPDLKGQVAAAKDFSRTGSATDRFGHGTHVASIIAGTGATGGSSMRGVAYQAKLLNGKVLDNTGSGYDSDIIAGMEWAAKSGADVINMSLGGGPSDGTDPIERSLNTLSKKYDVLFAVAAGNSRDRGPGRVSSPSTASAAMSVAAVDSKNKVAAFSDTGPGQGDAVLKPDIAAPGVDILGARSKVFKIGTGSSKYVRLSGTSMAAPHVAGAAALLAQARPELSGTQLKSALMAGATDRSGTVWEEGAGVVDVPRSIGMKVIPDEGSLSFGAFEYPQSKLKPVTKVIHYRNSGTKPVTLRISAEATGTKGAPAKGVSVPKTTLTVPAKGSASVQVRVDPAADPLGVYGGAVTAVPNAGRAIRTPIGWNNDVKRYNVTIKGVDRTGKRALMMGEVFDLRDNTRVSRSFGTLGETTMRLPAGTYAASAYLTPAAAPGSEAVIGARPEFTVKGNTAITLGGPSSKRMTVKTPKPSDMVLSSLSYVRRDARNTRLSLVSAGSFGSQSSVWATPTQPTTVGSAEFLESASLLGPAPGFAYNYQVSYLTRNRIPSSLAHTVNAKDVATVVGAYRSRVKGATGLGFWVPTYPGQVLSLGGLYPIRVPSTTTSYLVGKGMTWQTAVMGPMAGSIQGDFWVSGQARRFDPGTTSHMDFFSGIASPGAVSTGIAVRADNQLQAYMPIFEDAAGLGAEPGAPATRNTLTAYVDDREVGRTGTGQLVLPAPEGKTLKLVQQTGRKTAWWRTSTSTTGEWTAPLPTQNRRVVRLMNVQYSLAGRSMTGAVPPGPQTVGLSVSAITNPTSAQGRDIAPQLLTLEWSIDGGKTWRKAAVKRQGTKATATFTPPAQEPTASTMVSLRASAADGKGSTVKETVISAYEMTGLPPGTIATRK